MDEQLKTQQKGIGVSAAIFLTAGLMIAPAVVLNAANIPNFFIIGPFVDMIIGTAVGGAMGIRLFGLRWRQTIAAAFLFGGGRIVLLGFESNPFEYSDPFAEILNLVLASIVLLVICGAGVFLLPLFDPQVRRIGLAPTLWKAALAALALALIVLSAEYLLYAGAGLGLVSLLVGSGLSVVLVGIGLILALANRQLAGAWVGGLGILLHILLLSAWVLLGQPWIP